MLHTVDKPCRPNAPGMLSPVLLTMCLLLVPVCSPAAEPTQMPLAQSGDTELYATDSGVSVNGRLSVGLLNGEGNEYAYNARNGQKLSELIWSFDNNLMLGAGLSIETGRWLTVNGDVWLKLSDSSTMDDYDWRIGNFTWTDWSTHDDVELTTGTMFDLNTEIHFLRSGQSSLFGIVGLKKDNWAWDARGGSYVYSVNGFRDTTGSFAPGELVISYEQDITTPYLGLGFATSSERFSFLVRIIGSPFVSASADDTHYLRQLRFEDDFSGGTMLGLDLAFTYFLTPRLAIHGALHYQDFDEIKGDSVITDLRSGQRVATGSDTSGLAHSSSLVSLGVTYRF